MRGDFDEDELDDEVGTYWDEDDIRWLGHDGGAMSEKATFRAQRDCGYWLASCLALGWRRSDLDSLEALWWKYHDPVSGRLVSDLKRTVAPPPAGDRS